MWHQFTAASERALICASGWTSRTDCDELEAVPLLVGLLSEPECRAAMTLKKLSIGIAEVRRRWPKLTELPPQTDSVSTWKPLSREVDLSLQLAEQRLAPLPRPLELATEHILLGLASADHEVSIWLRQHGLDPEAYEAEILGVHSRHAESTESLEFDGGEETRKEAEQRSLGPVGTLRVLDAAANRAREGLRVVEDYVRFMLDDLTDALGRVPIEDRLAARETQADVGTVLTTAAERFRGSAADVLTANLARLQESLRSLEEFGKLLDADLAAAFKQIRYQAYTVQRAVEITRDSIERLAKVQLYVLVDGRRSAEESERLVRSLIDAGVGAIQLRDKQLEDRDLLERARLLRRLTQGTATLFIVNDRPDLAALARADGVHVGQEELSVKDARWIVGPEMLIGVSTHSIEQARQAVLDGANYIGVGPTFPSGTKTFERFPGIELLREVAAEIRLPAFAIGGIDRQNVAQVLAAGFSRIAVSGAVTSAGDPGQAARELLGRLNPT
jgi:thiamine-phosphate pyrophosphorylase